MQVLFLGAIPRSVPHANDFFGLQRVKKLLSVPGEHVVQDLHAETRVGPVRVLPLVGGELGG